MRILTAEVPQELDGAKVETVLRAQLHVSHTMLRRLKRREGAVCRNGNPVFTNSEVVVGDRITVDVEDLPEYGRAVPMEMPLRILFEDEDILILDKPAGISVHADDRKPEETTLENALIAYLGDGTVPHPVSRLDRGTSGVITYAKNAWMHERLKHVLRKEDCRKQYLAVCHGIPTPEIGEIRQPIGSTDGSKYERTVREDGKPAQTRYRVAEFFPEENLSLLQLIPVTGRTHQLRVHMAWIGCPMVGDWLYGTPDRERILRPALHAWRLSFLHPLSGKQIEISCSMPPDMSALLPEMPVLQDFVSSGSGENMALHLPDADGGMNGNDGFAAPKENSI